jgi:cyanophycinase
LKARLAFGALFLAAPFVAQAGSLVIVGGGLRKDNAAIFGAFIDRVPAEQTIAIIPSASGEPQGSANDFADNLVRHGFDRARIMVIQLAEVDDPETTSVDESKWTSNGRNRIEVSKLINAGGIWFSGGDQARTMRVLDRTPMLKLIRKRLKSGAVIGGTSAGAAIMGEGMILCGDPVAVLAQKVASRDVKDCAPTEGESEPLVIGKGLGFLPAMVVDQHFGERKRLPRLQLAVKSFRTLGGVGIDENTALVVDLKAKSASLVGAGGAILVQPSGAVSTYRAGEAVIAPPFKGPK